MNFNKKRIYFKNKIVIKSSASLLKDPLNSFSLHKFEELLKKRKRN